VKVLRAASQTRLVSSARAGPELDGVSASEVGDVPLHAMHVSRPLNEPLRPTLMVSPIAPSLEARLRRTSRCAHVLAASISTTRFVPSIDGPSSSLVMRNDRAFVSRMGADEFFGRRDHRGESALHIRRAAP